MKLFNISLPIIFAFLFTNIQGPDLPGNVSLTSENDTENCNRCASCEPECINSENACALAIVTATGVWCNETSVPATLSFPGNEQYICSITEIGFNVWAIDFNVIKYSCEDPTSPFLINIPVTLTYKCGPATYSVQGTVNYIIC